MERSAEESVEIERHKYFLSQERGYDVGWECAEEDWERHFAQQWREEHQAATSDNGASCDSVPSTAENTSVQTLERTTEQAAAGADVTHQPWFKSLLRRLFN